MDDGTDHAAAPRTTMELSPTQLNELATLLAACNSNERRQVAALLMIKEIDECGAPWVMHTVNQFDGKAVISVMGTTSPFVIARLQALADELGHTGGPQII